MKRKTRYAESYEPSAPVLLLRVGSPDRESAARGVALMGLVDTGADMTLIPESVAVDLDLPVVSNVRIAGVTGGRETAEIHAAIVSLAGMNFFSEIVAFGEEPIVGRDLLNRFIVRLDGPQRLLDISTPSKRRSSKGAVRRRRK